MIADSAKVFSPATPSTDHGHSRDFMTHRVLAERDIPGLENVAKLDGLPPTGATATLLVLEQLQRMIAASVLLGILPLPGLVAGGVLQAIWPHHERRLRQAEPICLFVVISTIVAFGFPDPATILRFIG